MLKIGEFARLAQVAVSTLRFYAEAGLLPPAYVDPFTGYRYYTSDQLPRLHRLLALRDLGFSLEAIRALLDEGVTPEQLRGMWRLRQAEQQARVHEEQERLERVAARLTQIEEDGRLPRDEVVLKAIEPQLIAAVRAVLPSYAAQAALWVELDDFLAAQRVAPSGPCLALFYDAGYQEHDVDIEVGEPVPASTRPAGRVALRQLPVVATAACRLHHGALDSVGQTYAALTQWIEANRFSIVGPAREVYLRAVAPPQSRVPYPPGYLTEQPSERLTEVQFPVEKRPL